jgi:uncharacterized iron-regulated protein
MERVTDRKIIYVGERHDQFSNHMMQLEIIKDLHSIGEKDSYRHGEEVFAIKWQANSPNMLLKDTGLERIKVEEHLQRAWVSNSDRKNSMP